MEGTISELTDLLTDEQLFQMCDSLYEFYYNFIAIDYPSEVDGYHLKVLAEKLENVERGEINNLCVAMPPRHSKSSMITLAYPIWLLTKNPNLRILIVNAESSLSENFGISLRDYIQDYGALFGLYLSDTKHAKDHLKFENINGELLKGSIRLVGAGGGITGQDADYLIIDDPYKGFEDITPTLLNKKINWFKTKIIQRREPDSKLIILHTRWHTNDLQGYLKANQPDKYEFLSFPAIKDDGNPLWPERYTLDFLNGQLEEMGERLFSSIYQQKPLDETGDFFNIDKLFYEESYDPTSTIAGRVRSWDLAYSDESKGNVNDSTAGILMHRTLDDKYIITDLEHGQYGDNLINVIKQTARADSPRVKILIETGTRGGASQFLFKEYKKKLEGYNVVQSEPIGSKVDRATPFKNAILDGKVGVLLDDHRRGKLLEQLKSFPLGSHDDIVDACAYAYLELQKTSNNHIMTGGQRRSRRRSIL